ncbi:MAG: hypothetical protein RBT65_03850 [Methanolobus sp.]|nr:hypothetical protein [Methanolobus sp.]
MIEGVTIIIFIENSFSDLQNIVINIPQCLIKYREIKENVQSINENLQMANDEIQVLKDDWQNKLMI